MNAFTWPSTFLTRSMHACARSRAEISLARTRPAASAIVNSLSMLFDDFGNQEKAVRLCRRVAQSLFVRKRRPGLIRPGDIHERHCMGGRFDLAHIELIQLLDITKNLPELRAELLLLGGGEPEPREVRHIFHVNFDCRHKDPKIRSGPRVGQVRLNYSYLSAIRGLTAAARRAGR